jgi:hypothetical protein
VQIRSGILVGGVLGMALGTVGLLTAQASDAPLRPRHGAAHRGAGADGTDTADARALPAASGSGERVVYSLGRQRVWLVDERNRVRRTYPVVGGEVAPAVGTHRVFAREGAARADAGYRVTDLVLFASTGGTNVGFCTPVDQPAPHRLGPAISEPAKDADALWQQAAIGTLVDVVR